MYDLNTVNKISHSAEIRNILLKHETKWRKSKIVLSNKSNNPHYTLKKSTLNSEGTIHLRILYFYI
jgi:hypothetical protein